MIWNSIMYKFGNCNPRFVAGTTKNQIKRKNCAVCFLKLQNWSRKRGWKCTFYSYRFDLLAITIACRSDGSFNAHLMYIKNINLEKQFIWKFLNNFFRGSGLLCAPEKFKESLPVKWGVNKFASREPDESLVEFSSLLYRRIRSQFHTDRLCARCDRSRNFSPLLLSRCRRMKSGQCLPRVAPSHHLNTTPFPLS